MPDRYIHAGTGSDQLVGRSIALLPNHDPEFASLGPHFTREGLRLISETLRWNKLYSGFVHLPGTFQRVMPYLLANIVFHFPWLEQNLPKNHPLWRSNLFAGNDNVIGRLKPHVMTGINRNDVTEMQATGIPGHLCISAKIRDLELAIEKSEKAAEANHQQLLKSMQSQPQLLKDMLLSHFDGLGPRAASTEDLKAAVDELAERLSNQFQTLFAAAGSSLLNPGGHTGAPLSSALHGSLSGTGSTDDNGITRGYMHYWNSQFRYFCHVNCTSACHQAEGVAKPGNFEVPNCSAKDMFRLWHLGSQYLMVGPFKVLARDRVSKQALSRLHYRSYDNLIKAATVMEKFDEIGLANFLLNNPGRTKKDFTITASNWDEVFDGVFRSFCDTYYSQAKRKESRRIQTTYTTLLNRIMVIGGSNNTQQAVESAGGGMDDDDQQDGQTGAMEVDGSAL